ncbi:MAG TPA: hypothetical protein VN419_04925 [Humidesulfovibrio sp.]|uniref:hypothetical protein n=1 Tax=Humidesulfovibrio sp. TaxID=2910988 RepID=UPI002CDB9CF9|nr:hypothetical protein [Humidesulfovibrio sp.]HWR03344.1 hypothetical protein [Humidesulfovibrio sp.]
MATVVPQSELTRRAIDWIAEKCGPEAGAKARACLIEDAAMRFNLGPLEVEFIERFFANETKGETRP